MFDSKHNGSRFSVVCYIYSIFLNYYHFLYLESKLLRRVLNLPIMLINVKLLLFKKKTLFYKQNLNSIMSCDVKSYKYT